MTKRRDRLAAADIQGAWAIMPTPSTPGGPSSRLIWMKRHGQSKG